MFNYWKKVGKTFLKKEKDWKIIKCVGTSCSVYEFDLNNLLRLLTTHSTWSFAVTTHWYMNAVNLILPADVVKMVKKKLPVVLEYYL